MNRSMGITSLPLTRMSAKTRRVHRNAQGLHWRLHASAGFLSAAHTGT